jgi:hypothetical protein
MRSLRTTTVAPSSRMSRRYSDPLPPLESASLPRSGPARDHTRGASPSLVTGERTGVFTSSPYAIARAASEAVLPRSSHRR